MSDRPSILGIGNSERGDDGVGPYVLRGLAQLGPDADLYCSDGEIAGLISIFQGCTDLILIDAADGAAAGLGDGEVLRFDARDGTLAQEALRSSTHSLGVAEALNLASALGCLPEKVEVIAIAGSSFAVGAQISAPVATAADILVTELAGLYAPEPVSATTGAAGRPQREGLP